MIGIFLPASMAGATYTDMSGAPLRGPGPVEPIEAYRRGRFCVRHAGSWWEVRENGRPEPLEAFALRGTAIREADRLAAADRRET